ncbi:phage holin, LLH family [Cohnella yongneupensis]|uniref:Phage holin, LLH family n=1 Tax=Cohnella yongneupensis TaxID=425006 RepID=A0ABW0QVB1_9BACL
MKGLEPYIGTIVEALVGLLVTYILAVIASLNGRLKEWLKTRTSAQQREVLHRIAAEGFALAESLFKGSSGPKKLNKAMLYVLDEATKRGLVISQDSIRAAVEKAVLEHNAKVKGGKAA